MKVKGLSNLGNQEPNLTWKVCHAKLRPEWPIWEMTANRPVVTAWERVTEYEMLQWLLCSCLLCLLLFLHDILPNQSRKENKMVLCISLTARVLLLLCLWFLPVLSVNVKPKSNHNGNDVFGTYWQFIVISDFNEYFYHQLDFWNRINMYHPSTEFSLGL